MRRVRCSGERVVVNWRDDLRRVADAVPPDQVSDAIGELEALKSRLWARLLIPIAAPTNHDPANRYLRPREVAELLGVNTRWVYRHSRELGGVQLSDRTLRFPITNVHAFAEAHASP